MYLHNPHLKKAKCENTIDSVEVCLVNLCLLNALKKKKKSLKSAAPQGVNVTSCEDAEFF